RSRRALRSSSTRRSSDLHGAPYRPGGDALGFLPQLGVKAVVPLMRREIPLEWDHLDASPKSIVLTTELRLVVRRQHQQERRPELDRKSTRLNSSHVKTSY